MKTRVYFIATPHEEYRTRAFPPGSTVIDPWRMIGPQPGVTVRRLGENRPAMISLLVPTRGRPSQFNRLCSTAFHTALFPFDIEVVAWMDDDDPHASSYSPAHRGLRYIVGPRGLLSVCWNRCADAASGEILMHCGDDITFNTKGWDQVVRSTFAAVPDRVAFVHGDDLSPHFPGFGTHGFVHRRWVETVGYFVPPLFSSDWNDVWLNEVANALGRRITVPIVTEHHHYGFGKAEHDATYREREERGRRDDVVGIYKRTAAERERDVEKLRAVMA